MPTNHHRTSSIYSKKPLPEFEWIERIVHLMDDQFRIPGTKIRFGIDPVLGLIPVAGELITFVISGLMVLSIFRYGVSGKVMILMLGNILLDNLIGGLPIVGDIFDTFFKANRRNLDLLKKHQEEGKYYGRGVGLIVGVIFFLVLILLLFTYIVWRLLVYLFKL